MASVYNTYQNSSLGMMGATNPNYENKVSVDSNGCYVTNPSQQSQVANGYVDVNSANYYAQASGYSYQGATGAGPIYYGQPQIQQQQPAPEPQVSGGVSSVLDYDLDIMSKFSTYLGFRLFDRKDTGNTQFVNSLKSVLSSVRLPLSSLILSNYFILEKFELDSASFKSQGNELDKIYESIVISLVLANKANDDNTFTNKSWSCATGLPIHVINKKEVEWLVTMGYRLHNTKMDRFNELMLQFEKYTNSVKAHEMEQMRLMEAKARQLQAQAQSVQQSINPINYYDQRSTAPFACSYAYSNARESQPKNVSIGNGYSRENYYSHRKNYSVDQTAAASQYYGQAQRTSTNVSSTSPYYNSYCLKSGSVQVDAYCSCSYCLAGSNSQHVASAYNSNGFSNNNGDSLNWRQHYCSNVSC